jgi:hypothetical protein
VRAAESLRDALADARGRADNGAVAARAGAALAAGPEAPTSPWRLARRSREAYQWLFMLGDAELLDAHIRAQLALEGRRWALGPAPPAPALYLMAPLARRLPSGRLVLHQGFMDAPGGTLAALGQALETSTGRTALRAYAAGAEFAAATRRLRAALGPPPDAVGPDIQARYQALNRAYFGGAQRPVMIAWASRRARRRLGAYDPATDTITLSPTLARGDVPPVLLDFVLYHEMLHRQLGVRMSRGRRRAHTAEFRRAERRFEGYAEARRLLGGPIDA